MTIWKLKGTYGEIVVLKQLGRGGMGEVYDANWLGTDGMVTTCVLKTLAVLLSDRDRERFLNEARIAAQLDHGNIVKVLMVGEIPAPLGGRGAPFLLMLRVDGVDLRRLHREAGRRFNLIASIFVGGECLAALEYAHERTVRRRRATVIHYDMKPSNILISSSGEVKLTDFGIARFASSVEGTLSQAVGTPRYMSPEQFSGKGDEKSDIFSLGIVLWELIEGVRLHAEHDDVTYQTLIMSGQIPELTQPDVPLWLAQLVRSMLALDPKDRPTAADARSIILEKAPHYQLGSKRLAEMYAEFIGESSSGLTGLLEAEGIGLEYKRLPVPQHVADGAVVGLHSPAPIAPPDEDTVTDRDRSEEDSPAVFRRRATPNTPARAEETYTDGPPLLRDHEPQLEPPSVVFGSDAGSDDQESEPMVDPTIRLSAMFDEDSFASTPITDQRWPAGRAPADSGPEIRATADSVPVAIVVPQPQPQRTMAWIIGVAGSTIIILLAVLIGLVVTWNRSQKPANAEPPATVADPEPRDPETTDEPKAAPTPVDVVNEVADVKPVEVEPNPATGGGPTDETGGEPTDKTDAEPTTEPVPEVEPEPKKKPKPKAQDRILVIFKVPGSPQHAEVKVGSRLLKYNYAATTKLTPGTYPVRWRLKPEDAWQSPGSLVVEDIGSTKHYDVSLSESKITRTIREQGGK